MHRGWFKLWRKIDDNPLMCRASYLAVWIDILLRASHEGGVKVMFGKQMITLEPGQFTTGAYQISVRRGVPRGTVERIINSFKNEELIEVQSDHQCSLITVKNWALYQKVDEKIEERVRNARGTSEERVRTNKEVKKLRIKELTTNNIATASPSLVVGTRARTPLQEVVDHFFDLLGLDPSQRSVSYPRHVRDGQALLKACSGDPKKAIGILDALHAWAAGKKLDYTIGTALKQWQRFSSVAPAESYEAKMARVQAEVDKFTRNKPT